MHRTVIKRDGSEERFRTQEIINAIFEIIKGMEVEDDYELVFKIIKELDLKVPERVTTEELDVLVLKAIEHLIPKHPIYDTLATLQLLKLINKRIDRKFKSFSDYLKFNIESGYLKQELAEFNLQKIEHAIDYKNDRLLDYFGLTTLRDRYLSKDTEQEVIEKPQWFFMRVAMGIGNDEPEVIAIYEKMSRLEYLHSTPTLFNSGTSVSQYSSCYVNVVDDSLAAITDKLTETAFLAKYAGGVGTDVSRVRATGSHIKSLNAKSSGVIPFIKVFDTMVNSIQQGGRRRSSQVISLQPWHYDIEAFMELRETTGNAYFRTPSLNTKLWMPDEMMRRIEKNDPIYLFDPGECPELVDAIGNDFAAKYKARILQTETGELKLFKKLQGRDFFKKYLFKLAKTGHPWLTFKDAHNRHNPCPNYSVINSSNLCTEIAIPNKPDSTAVCTLASINLSKHINNDYTDFNWKQLEETIRIIVKALDNVLDKNFYPTEASRKNTMDLRPLGIGIMGFAEALVQLRVAYDSTKAVEIAQKLGQFFKEKAYDASEKLAAEKGAFAHYDEMKKAGVPYNYSARRNAVLLAIAPTATISIISGTTSSIDSYFSNLYSRDTLSGKYIVINKRLIQDLESKGLWNEEIADAIKRNNGSVQHIEALQGKIDIDLYKTTYEVHPKRQIDIAAAFQKSVDQAVSKSIYIDEQLRAEMEDIYLYAWKKELKSTYYCFIDKVIKGEKYTSEVNKRGARKGFGRSKTQAVHSNGSAKIESEIHLNEVELKAREKFGDQVVDEVMNSNGDSCPTDPMLAKLCPSCE
ncbi:ribonucleoside-diphosphate reductase subunit alpha [uncultured Sunxiuqinia sp.]|uniref:ribonucleoside-diphosphate reductase subunit alpha n=1 Tax=uncultured Sunxiuqinia sp. TaxID=1573825 RepID=UPI002AA7C450|nr:ribonucleoside-diphosphate reductase subunit alpha [uncultured Sunxiuqinia sp.]